MTDNEKLARWQGIKRKPQYSLSEAIHGMDSNFPDYLNDDAAAMSLLDTLVEKGYSPRLEYDYEQDQWAAVIFQPVAMGADCVLHKWKPTRREAVVAAVLELIEKEKFKWEEDPALNGFRQQKYRAELIEKEAQHD